MKTFYRCIAMLCCLTICSCASIRNYNSREAFEKSMKDYNRKLRWQEMENAGMLYMDSDAKDAFYKTSASIRKRGVSVTDYRIVTSECVPDKGTAEALVEFDYFTLPSNRVKTLTYRQNWVYIDTDEKTGWQLKSALPEFD
jgi:hypothetical protein